MPAYEEAIKSLDTLQKGHIGEMKRFANPPALVGTCMEAVCILFNRKSGWGEAQKLLGEPDFLVNCKTFKKDDIPNATVKKIANFILAVCWCKIFCDSMRKDYTVASFIYSSNILYKRYI